jgi:glyoxylase-like metal-dependent hydrolase (beta-lactamase superfamily II)
MIPPIPLTKNITLLGTQFFNLYLVKGETYALIEGGVSGIAHDLLAQLNQLNVSPEAISHLVILHSHFDHMMIFFILRERYPWLKIVSSRLNQAVFSSERILAKIFDADRKITLGMMERGLISEAPNIHPGISLPLDLPVEGNSTLDLGKGVKLTFVDTPGHSPDCLAAYDDREEILFCSDAAGFYLPPEVFRPNYWYSLEESDKSFDRMKRIDPKILCRGHHGAIIGRESVRRNLQAAHQSMKDFKTFVLNGIQKGGSVDDLTKQVTDQFSKGFLELFPYEENYRLWKLLIRRTLEHLGIEIEERPQGTKAFCLCPLR